MDEQPLDEPVSMIHRRVAGSGRVSYGDPVVLHETTQRRITLVPFFVPRTSGTDLSIKLITYKKSPPPNDWAILEEKSLSLDEPAARKLLHALRQHLAVADEAGDGSYITIRVAEGTAHLGDHEPAAVAGALAKVLGQQEILQHLQNTELTDELMRAFRGAIRLNEMRSAVAQLRQHLDAGEASEGVYQDWCERHSWAFGNAYVMRDEVREISPGDKLDLLLPTVISGFRDIVELKRPDPKVLHYDEAHRNYYFSADVSRAIGQAHRYLDVLHEVAVSGLRDHPEIVAYHPRAIIVIGRSTGWTRDQLAALHGLNRRLSGVTVMSYDQLLAQGERLIEMLGAPPQVDDAPPPPELETWGNDADIPF
jgi:hypothetical protein